ncbi:hypothetical protein [Stutzerimonas nitrititolerans]|uniref:Uncharacterized protein n=1 Tax=Stutzerimonas nitrititolerans TaxID=2482751 RepID=A0AA42BBV8_9GAMM|nr:hypothetical protein [Stutzerimonas nitrititolerans]MCO7543717.1 hypothetical protein [Stutzerimonas nitrititolerans]
MTEAFWSSWFAFALLAGPILLAVITLAFSFYLSRFHLDAMIEALKGSRYIAVWATGLQNHGWFGRFMLTAKVSGMVTWPGPGIRAGELDPDEIRNFPRYLKRLVVAETVLHGVILVWGVIVSVLLQLK